MAQPAMVFRYNRTPYIHHSRPDILDLHVWQVSTSQPVWGFAVSAGYNSWSLATLLWCQPRTCCWCPLNHLILASWDLQALMMKAACMEFGVNDCMVRLTPRCGYIPKVLSILSLESSGYNAGAIWFSQKNGLCEIRKHALCRVHALHAYVDRASHFCLVICFGGV